jgi:hypothetical protein
VTAINNLNNSVNNLNNSVNNLNNSLNNERAVCQGLRNSLAVEQSNAAQLLSNYNSVAASLNQANSTISQLNSANYQLSVSGSHEHCVVQRDVEKLIRNFQWLLDYTDRNVEKSSKAWFHIPRAPDRLIRESDGKLHVETYDHFGA